MRAPTIRILLCSLAVMFGPAPVHAIPFDHLDITLDARVRRVTGGGSFTTPTPSGGIRLRTYSVSEIPNFYWKVGDRFTLRWKLTPDEVAQLSGGPDKVACFPHYQFLGTTPAGFPPDLCDKLSEDAPFSHTWELDPPSIGPSVNLETGVVTPHYGPQTLWDDWCCAYYYDSSTDAFVAGGMASFPTGQDSQRVPYFSQGMIGARHGRFSYLYAIDPLGAEAFDWTRPEFATGSAEVLFNAVWRVNGSVIPEPGSLALASLAVVLLIGMHRGARHAAAVTRANAAGDDVR